MKSTRCLLILAAWLLTTPLMATAARAQASMPGARPAGMGEAANAVSDGTSGIFHNPAGIARAIMYGIDGTFGFTKTGNVLSASVVDSKTNPSVSAGFGVIYAFGREATDTRTSLALRLPLAFPVVPDKVSLGVTASFLKMNDKDDTGKEFQLLRGFTFDVGALFRATDELSIGILARNLLKPTCATCEQSGEVPVPMVVGGGVAYGDSRAYVISADLDFDLDSGDGVNINVEVGGEYLIEQAVPVRVGFRRVGFTDSNLLTVGTGWRSSAAGVDASYQHDLTGGGFGSLLVGVMASF